LISVFISRKWTELLPERAAAFRIVHGELDVGDPLSSTVIAILSGARPSGVCGFRRGW
jgi:hypothetical protein